MVFFFFPLVSHGDLQILMITLDNASNNNTLINELVDFLDSFQGQPHKFAASHTFSISQSRCVHSQIVSILSNGSQAILSQFNKKTTTITEEDDDEAALEALEDELDDSLEIEPGEEEGQEKNVNDNEIDPSIEAHNNAAVNALELKDDDAASLPVKKLTLASSQLQR